MFMHFVFSVLCAAFMTQVNNEGIKTLDQLASQQKFAYGLLVSNPLLTKLLPTAKDHPYRYV